MDSHKRRPALKSAGIVIWALALGCVPDDPTPEWVGPFPPDSGVTDTGVCTIEFYPCGLYGNQPCDLIEDLQFIPVNEHAEALAGDQEVLALHDIYADLSVGGILLFGTAGWCQFCGQEGEWLSSIYPEFQETDGSGSRIEFVAVIFQDDYGAPATADYAAAYAARRGFPFPAVADPSGGILDYFDPSAAPGNVFIAHDDMRIQHVIQGFDQAGIDAELRALDGTATCQ